MVEGFAPGGPPVQDGRIHMGNDDAAESTLNGAVAADESELLSQLQRGDTVACEQFVRSRITGALTVARRILGREADADEAVQDAFFSFFKSLEGFRSDAALSTWLHRIVINAALMKRRSLKRNKESSIDDLLPQFNDDGHRVRSAASQPTSDHAEQNELRAIVRKKIDELPDDYRNVILLRDIEQLDTDETARLLGDSPGAVKTRLHRARQALRTLLEKESVF